MKNEEKINIILRFLGQDFFYEMKNKKEAASESSTTVVQRGFRLSES